MVATAIGTVPGQFYLITRTAGREWSAKSRQDSSGAANLFVVAIWTHVEQGGDAMVSLIGSMALWVAVGSTGGIFFNRNPNTGVLPAQPGYGTGFTNGNLDGYGWVDFGDKLPLTSDRVPDYFFRRYRSIPATQMFFPGYYNPYISRGQRFLPYAGCGGPHPMSTPPSISAEEPVHPYNSTLSNAPQIQTAPTFSGKVEAPAVNPGSTGLRP